MLEILEVALEKKYFFLSLIMKKSNIFAACASGDGEKFSGDINLDAQFSSFLIYRSLKQKLVFCFMLYRPNNCYKSNYQYCHILIYTYIHKMIIKSLYGIIIKWMS
jgi:hypothetical protein